MVGKLGVALSHAPRVVQHQPSDRPSLTRDTVWRTGAVPALHARSRPSRDPFEAFSHTQGDLSQPPKVYSTCWWITFASYATVGSSAWTKDGSWRVSLDDIWWPAHAIWPRLAVRRWKRTGVWDHDHKPSVGLLTASAAASAVWSAPPRRTSSNRGGL